MPATSTGNSSSARRTDSAISGGDFELKTCAPSSHCLTAFATARQVRRCASDVDCSCGARADGDVGEGLEERVGHGAIEHQRRPDLDLVVERPGRRSQEAAVAERVADGGGAGGVGGARLPVDDPLDAEEEAAAA